MIINKILNKINNMMIYIITFFNNKNKKVYLMISFIKN